MQRAILVAVETNEIGEAVDAELSELEALANAAGAQVLERIVQRRASVDPATLVGSGKAHEIALRAAELDAKVVITLNDLRPRQRKTSATCRRSVSRRPSPQWLRRPYP